MPKFSRLLAVICLLLISCGANAQDRTVTVLGEQITLNFPVRFQYKGRYLWPHGLDAVLFSGGKNDMFSVEGGVEYQEKCEALPDNFKIKDLPEIDAGNMHEYVINGKMHCYNSILRKCSCEFDNFLHFNLTAQNYFGLGRMLQIVYISEIGSVDWDVISQLENSMMKLDPARLD